MDIKITSITREIMDQALNQAHAGRQHILGKMAKAISASRAEISDFAPAMESFPIDKEKIREVIGSGGKVIRGLSEEYGCAIDITDDGIVSVASANRQQLKRCVQAIKDIVAVAEIGKEYDGEVVRVVDFGAFIKFMPNQEGLVHISEMVPVRLQEVADIVNEGDKVRVKVVNVEMGKVRLTMKDLTQPDEIAARQAASIERNGARPEGAAPIVREERPRRDDRGDRRPRRRD
jgi:polyribonucleotide nucleotidyltransferase